MARKQKLKVYRTPIGFHDAYVAAPSQKAALEAWGADVDLFARGVAEAVDDEALTQGPLERPGTVVRVARGSKAEHMAALPEDKPVRRKVPPPADYEVLPPRRRTGSDAKRPKRRASTKASKATEADEPQTIESAPTPKPKTKSKPRPSRARLDKAEEALELSEAEHREIIAGIREQEKELQQRRRDLEMRQEDEVGKLEAAIARARDTYSAALEKWRL